MAMSGLGCREGSNDVAILAAGTVGFYSVFFVTRDGIWLLLIKQSISARRVGGISIRKRDGARSLPALWHFPMAPGGHWLGGVSHRAAGVRGKPTWCRHYEELTLEGVTAHEVGKKAPTRRRPPFWHASDLPASGNGASPRSLIGPRSTPCPSARGLE
jgi:hypothetical protein